jgi:anhydro-N-acetylmuramic acid kinase
MRSLIAWDGPMSKVMRAIGLMSGTSLDGLDIALIETDGEGHVRRYPGHGVAYPEAFRERLRQALGEAARLTRRDARTALLTEVEGELTQRHAEALLRFMGDRMLQPAAIDVIGFHGQTVLHRPADRLTIQLGDGPALARATGIDVVYDLRAADVAAGGQGAPLVPVYHRALAGKVAERPIVFLNIGGVANVTWIGRDGALLAFDTGPGNALIDDWMLKCTGAAVDRDGAAARSGRVAGAVVQEALMHPYFSRLPPKSLDRQAFQGLSLDNAGTEDGAATLTAVTVECIARAREHFPEQPALWVVCGGGRRNRTLMEMLAARVENAVAPAEALQLDGDSMEAEAWAYLAVRALKGLALSYPGTTGVSAPMTGGVVAATAG